MNQYIHYSPSRFIMRRIGILFLFIALILLGFMLTGCVTPPPDDTAITTEKITVLGVDFFEPTSRTRTRIGLVRHFVIRVPTGTNAIYTPVYESFVDANLTLRGQSAIERFSVGQPLATNLPSTRLRDMP